MSFYHLNTLGSCRLTSQLSANIIWTSSGCLKLQKLDFCKKIWEKTKSKGMSVLALFDEFFYKNPISEVSNIRQTSKLYSQIAEMLIYKIREYGNDRMTFSKFFRRSQNFYLTHERKMCLFEKCLKSMKIGQNLKKIDFFKTSQVFTPTMINEKMQLG